MIVTIIETKTKIGIPNTKIKNIMAIFHCSVKVIGRSSGRSATGAAAYRSGTKIECERYGLTHDYTNKKVDYINILAPEKVPDWIHDRSTLWNKVEQVEIRKDAQLCREVEVSLPVELSKDQQIELAEDYIQSQFVEKGMVADIAIHGMGTKNPHAHILLSMRTINQVGFGKKNRIWNDKKVLSNWREQWEVHANSALEKAGHELRIDHRTLEAQGIDRMPQIHIGPAVSEMEARGIKTQKGEVAAAIDAANELLEEIDNDCRREEGIIGTIRDSKPEGKQRRLEPDESLGNQVKADNRERSNDNNSGRKVEGRTDTRSTGGSSGRTRSVFSDIERRDDNIYSELIGAGVGESKEHSEVKQGDHGSSKNTKFSGGRNKISRRQLKTAAILGKITTDGRREYNKPSPTLSRISLLARRNTAGINTRSRLRHTDISVIEQINKQLNSMGCDMFEIRVTAKNGRITTKEWTQDDVIKQIYWLSGEDAKGGKISIKPIDDNSLVFIGGLTEDVLKDITSEDSEFEPATVIRSRDRIDAWIRISDYPMKEQIIDPVNIEIKKHLKAKPFEYGALAGFSGFVCTSSRANKCTISKDIIKVSSDAYQKQQQKEAEQKQVNALLQMFYDRSNENKDLDKYLNIFKTYQHDFDTDYLELDTEAAKEMILKGVNGKLVAAILTEYSPISASSQSDNYGSEITKSLIKDPEVSKYLAKAVYLETQKKNPPSPADNSPKPRGMR